MVSIGVIKQNKQTFGLVVNVDFCFSLRCGQLLMTVLSVDSLQVQKTNPWVCAQFVNYILLFYKYCDGQGLNSSKKC